jgi:genome maintenance exonuclease 1
MEDKDIQEYHNIGKEIKFNNKYRYMSGLMYEHHGSRMYDFGGVKLPSVTTILSMTKDQKFLTEWKQKVGVEKAEQIKNHSSIRGTSMHKFLESHITGKGYDDLSPIGNESRPMAHKIIEIGLAPVDEYFGSEIMLHYPGLYAGSTDLVCMHNGQEAIVDFKQSNRPKKEEWVQDYYLQIAAYAMAHDYVHGSKIEKGVIMMCTPDLYYQEFVLSGAELRTYKHKFLKRLDMYHDLKFSEKEEHNTQKENEEYLEELKKKL